MARTVGLLAELLESILQENRSLLLELNVSNVISACKRENPTIARLSIGSELHVDSDAVPDDPASHTGLVSLIFTVREYLEVFVGVSDSEARIERSMAHFTGKHDNAELANLRQLFPSVFSMGAPNTEIDIESLDDLEKVKAIFLGIMRRAAAESAVDMVPSIIAYLEQSPYIKSVSGDLGQMEYSFGLALDEALSMFSDAMEKLDISKDLAQNVLADYGNAPVELGISSELFGGALSNTTTFGCSSIDRLLRDGIKRDDTLVLEGPAGVEKEILASLFLREGLQRNGCVIIVSAISTVEFIRQGLATAGLDIPKAESEGRIIFVDWYSRFTERITSIDDSGAILRVSNDLTNLAVGIDMALRKSDRHTQSRIVIDMASPTIITEGFDRVHDFLNSVRAKLKNHSCTGLVLVNPGMHSHEETGMLEEIFDGTMRIERAEENGRISSSFRISHLSSGAFSGSSLTLCATHRGLEISSNDESQSEFIPFDHDSEKAVMGLLGIESLSPNGLPMGKSFLVWVPSSMMPADYVKPVVMEAQKEGHALLLAMSSLGTESMGEWMSEKGLSQKGLLDRGLLQIVDWHSQKSAKVLGMEVDEGIIRTSRDMTHLGVGIDLALRKISDQFSSMAVMEILSPALRLFDVRMVYSFAQSMNAKLARRGFTTFMLMERDAHEPMVNAAVEELFDGIIDIRSARGALELGIISLRGSHFQSEYRPLNKLRDRLTIDVSRRIPDSEIAGAIASHGLSSRMKRLEKELNQAMEEKQSLERKLTEMSEREAEHGRRHDEMKATIQEIESKLKEPAGIPIPDPGTDDLHRKEMARLLSIMDEMLENLPKEIIDSFAKSDDFKLYEKIIRMYLEEQK